MSQHDQTNGEDFGKGNFPPTPNSTNEETKKAELYPENIQDMVNNFYGHNKVLPRIEGEDYVANPTLTNEGAETKSTFPYKY